MSGDGQLPAGACGRGAALHGALPAREGPHRHCSVQPFTASACLERGAQIFHPPPVLGTPSRAAPYPPKIWEGGSLVPGMGLGELCVFCWVLGQVVVSGVSVADKVLHGTPGMCE